MGFVARIKKLVGDGIDKVYEDQGIDNENALSVAVESIGGSGVLNGSFEQVDSGDPVGITITTGGPTPGSYAIDEDTADVRHGYRSLSMITASVNDTVQVDWDEYTPCAPGDRIAVDWENKFTAANLTLKVEILWYYWNGAAFVPATTASETLYDDSTTNPTAWSERKRQAVAPAGANPARYYRLRFTFGKAAAATTGTMHLDGVSSRIYHGLVVVDMNAAAALITSSLSTGFTQALPSAIIGDEMPHTALLHVSNLAYTGGDTGTTFMAFQDESGGIYGGYYIIAVDQGAGPTFIQRLPHIICPIRQRDQTIRISEGNLTGSSNMATRDIYLAAYYV